MRPLLTVARREHASGMTRELPLPIAALGTLAGQPFKPPFDLELIEQDLRGLRPIRRFLPVGEAAEQPFLGALGLGDMRREHLRPRPAKPHQRLK